MLGKLGATQEGERSLGYAEAVREQCSNAWCLLGRCFCPIGRGGGAPSCLLHFSVAEEIQLTPQRERAKGWDESGLAPAPSLHTHRSVCSVVKCFQHFISLCCERGSTAKARGGAMLRGCCKASLSHGHCFPSQLFEDYAPNSQRPGTQVRRDLPAFGRRQWERGSAHHGGGMQAS